MIIMIMTMSMILPIGTMVNTMMGGSIENPLQRSNALNLDKTNFWLIPMLWIGKIILFNVFELIQQPHEIQCLIFNDSKLRIDSNGPMLCRYQVYREFTHLKVLMITVFIFYKMLSGYQLRVDPELVEQVQLLVGNIRIIVQFDKFDLQMKLEN